MLTVGTWPLARYLAALTSSKTFDPVVTPSDAHFRGTGTFTYGVPYVALVTGIQAYVEDTYDPAGGSNHSVTVTFPKHWDTVGVFVWSGTGYLGSISVRLEFTDWNHEADSDCNWLLEFSQLHIQVLIGGVWATVYTIGPQSDAGNDFDKRYETSALLPYAAYAPAVVALGAPVCAGDYDSQPGYLNNAFSSFVGGYEVYDGSTWQRDTIKLFSVGLANTPACSCFVDPPGGTAANSAEITTEAFTQDQVIRGPKTTRDFCPDGCVGTAIHDVWTLTQKTTSRLNSITACADNWGIKDLNVHTFELGCTGSETPVTSDTLHPALAITYSQETRSIINTEGSITCHFGPNHCACVAPDGPVYPPANPLFCFFGGEIDITWPTAPPCSLALMCLASDVTDAGRHSLGWTQDGTFWLASSDNKGTSWPEKDSGLSASCCAIAYDRQIQPTPLFVWVEDGGAIKRYRTDNEGDSYGMPTTVSTGTGNSFPSARIRRAGLVYQYWIHETAGVYDVLGRIDDRAENIVVAEFTAITGVEKSGLTAEDFVDADGQHKIALWVIQGGSKVRWVSENGQSFA